MSEFRRVFGAKRRALALLLIVLFNLCLFLRQQQAENWGFLVESWERMLYGDVDAKAARALYEELLETYQGVDYDTAIREVSALADARNIYNDIRNILNTREMYLSAGSDGEQRWEMYFEADYQRYLEEYPDLVASVSAGEGPEAVQVQAGAAGKLLRQLEHLAGYEDYLAQVQANADRLSSFAIFNQKGGFTNRNIQKTAADFAVLDAVQLSLGRDDAVTALFSCPAADWMLVAVLAMTAIAFLDERQKGLWHTAYAAPNGRLRLALRRVGVLAVTSVAAVTALYGSVLGLGFALYGGADDLGRPAQSLAMFKTLPVVTSVGGVLIRYFLLRMLSAFVIGLLIWLLLSIANTGVRWMLAGFAVFLGVEYSFYAFLPDLSILQLLKYFNIFSYIDLSALYTRYLNLDVFTLPVNIRALAAWSCVPLALVFGAGCVEAQRRMRPTALYVPFTKLSQQVNRLLDRLIGKLRLTGFEAYKLFIMQGGIILLAAFVYFMAGADVSVPAASSIADDYALQLQGEITDGTLERIGEIRKEVDGRYDLVVRANTRLEAGEITFDEYYDTVLANSDISARKAGIMELSATAHALYEKGESMGRPMWLLYEMPYRGIYGAGASHVRTGWNLLALFALALLLSGVLAMERSSAGLLQLLHASPRGRGGVLRRKLVLSGVAVLLLWAVPTVLELRTLLAGIDPATLAAPVQSLSFLGEFPALVSIRGFLIGMYLARLLALLACACAVLFLSGLFRRVETACLAACAVLVLPTVLWSYLDIVPFRFLSAARVTDMIGLITEQQGQGGGGFLGLSVLMLIGVVCMVQMVRCWDRAYR